jgi:hypothetical protein
MFVNNYSKIIVKQIKTHPQQAIAIRFRLNMFIMMLLVPGIWCTSLTGILLYCLHCLTSIYNRSHLDR